MTRESALKFLNAAIPPVIPIAHGRECETVADAALALGVEPERIAKCLVVKGQGTFALVVMPGNAKLDNAKAKRILGYRPRMASREEAAEVTGHRPGGICPFGLKMPLQIYCDVSLLDFDTVYPAVGDASHSLEIIPRILGEVTTARWVDIAI